MSKKYFLFDLDGTLIKSIPSIMESFRRAVKAVYGNIPFDDKWFLSTIGLPLTDAFKIFPEKDREILHSEYVKANAELQQGGVPFCDGVEEELRKLKKAGKILAIVSAKRKDPVNYWVDIAGVRDLFSAIVCKEDTVKHKPDGEPVLYCLKLLSAKKSEAVYIGDAEYDLLSATNAGVTGVLVGWTEMNKEKLSVLADFIAEKPEDLEKL